MSMDKLIKDLAREGDLVVFHVKDFAGGIFKTYWASYPNRHKDGTYDPFGTYWDINKSISGKDTIIKRLRKTIIMTDDCAKLNRDLEDFKSNIQKKNIKKIPTAYEWFNNWIKKFKKS